MFGRDLREKKVLFSVTHRYSPGQDLTYVGVDEKKYNYPLSECLGRLIDYHPDDDIVVVDSNSPDKSYFDDVKRWGIEPIDAKNNNFTTGNIWYTYENFPDYDYYVFLHDTFFVEQSISNFFKNDINSTFWFGSWNGEGHKNSQETHKGIRAQKGFDTKEQMDWANEQLEKHTNYKMEDDFSALFGPMLLCKREILDKLYKNGFSKVLPTNKDESMAMERVWGSVLYTEGYKINLHTIMGCYFRTTNSIEECIRRHGEGEHISMAEKYATSKNNPDHNNPLFTFRSNQFATKIFLRRT